MDKLLKSFRIAHSLAFIPIGMLVILATQNPTLPISTIEMLMLLGFFTVVMSLSRQLQSGRWGGYIALSAYLIWVTGGLFTALLLVVIGTLIAQPISWFIHKQKAPTHEIIPEILGRIATIGMMIIAAHGIVIGLHGDIPFTTVDTSQIAIPTFAIFISYFIMTGIGVLVTDFKTLQSNISIRFITQEVSLSLLVLILPLMKIGVGSTIFWILIGILILQSIRHYQAELAYASFTRRLNDMSLLNTLSQSMSSSIELDEVLDTIYHEIRNIVSATSFFVAQYNPHSETIEYPIVYVEGITQIWAKRKMGQSLSDYVIRTRKPIHLDTNDIDQLANLNINKNELDNRVYIGVPMLIGDKLIGALVVAHRDNPQAFDAEDIELLQIVANQASLALRNATLYQKRVDFARDLSLINHTLQEVTVNLDRSNALKTLCQVALQVGKAQKAAFYIMPAKTTTRMNLSQSLGLSDTEKLITLPYHAETLREGLRVISNISTTNDPDLQQHASEIKFTSIVQMPLLSSRTILGCLCLYHDEEYVYETAELNLLETLNHQLNTAIENRDLFQEMENYADEQGRIALLSQISTTNLDLEPIIKEICNLITRIMQYNRAEIAHYNSRTQQLHFHRYHSGDTTLQKAILPISKIPEFQSFLEDSTSKPAVYYANKPSHSDQLQAYMSQNNDETFIICPLRLNQQDIGLLLLADTRDHTFGNNDRRLLDIASNQIAFHIHNAYTHNETHETLKRRLAELSLLEESAQQISQTLDINEIIGNVLTTAMTATDSEFAALALRNRKDDHLFDFLLREEYDGNITLRKVTTPIAHGIVGQVINSGATRVIGNNQENPDYYVVPNSTQKYCSSLVVPLFNGEQVIGVLNLESTQPDYFTDDHINFILSLAGHAAVSLANAHLVEAINKSNEQMRAILDSTRDGIILLDNDGRLLSANITAEILTGIPLSQHIESPLADVIDNSEKIPEIFAEISSLYKQNPQSINETEYTYQNNDNQKITLKLLVIDVNVQESESGHILILRDISEEIELRTVREKNERLVIHDLQSPLSSIITSLSWTTELAKKASEQSVQQSIEPNLHRTLNSAKQLLSLVQTLRDIPTISAETIKTKPVLVRKLANNAYEMLAGTILNAGITVDYDIPDRLMVNANYDFILRLFVNLIHNAEKFTPDNGKILIAADIVPDQPDFVRIRVCDSGIGIPEAHSERIFGQFEQIIENLPQRGIKGTGLGLNFSQLVVDAHGGKIWVEQEDKLLSGACIAFTLPLATTSQNLQSLEDSIISPEISAHPPQ